MSRQSHPGAPIPFTLPTLEGNEERYMTEALTKSRLSGDGPFTKRCNAFLEEAIGVHKALLTTSCTAALEMAALLLKVQPGDEVIVPSFTFVSSIFAGQSRSSRTFAPTP
jgi:dTDP-4-amino-4,6-dideoxygalactose transaminase